MLNFVLRCTFFCGIWLLIYLFFSLQERAKEIADTIGGDALSLADLNDFHPEDGMILANTTSVGMQPKVDETPISKVRPLSICFSYSETSSG